MTDLNGSLKEYCLTTQYIWSLENDYVFTVLAKHEIERKHFVKFTHLVRDVVNKLEKTLNDKLRIVDRAYINIETWLRMGGAKPDFIWNKLDLETYGDQQRILVEYLYPKPTNTNIDKPIPKNQPTELASEPKKETTVSNKIEFKTITYINNVDVTKLTDEQLIDAIKTIENEIAALKAVKTKSTKITTKVTEANETLTKVVMVLDAR